MARTPQEIMQHHARALGAADLDELASDYTDDAVLITPHGVYKGREGAREAWARLLDDLPNPQVEVTGQVLEGDLLLIEYTVESDKARVTDGVDTFVLGGDGIRRQTVRYSHQAA